MEKLCTIQKRGNLNEVYRDGEKGPGGGYHDYSVVPKESCGGNWIHTITFQKGPRKDPNARHGVADEDLLEIVRDRIKAFQEGPYATRENACALTHVEEALLWLNKRSEDRLERGVLGTYQK